MTDPAPQASRIAALDIVRGMAVMGILTMNIVAFGLPEAAYLNPRAYGGDTGIDLAAYLVNFVAFDGKMRGLFSFLFGASTLLVIERAEGRGDSAARVHYARMIWLLGFGVLHFYLLWWGDILSHYALVGMVVFAFRDWRPRALIAAAVALIALQSLLIAGVSIDAAHTIAQASQPNPPAEAVKHLSDLENQFGKPARSAIAEDLAIYRGDYAGTVAERAQDGILPFVQEFAFIGMETLGYMLLGMAMLKAGMLRGAWPRARNLRWMAIGFGISVPAYIAIAYYLVAAGFTAFSVALGALALSTPFRPLMIIGWASLIMLVTQRGGPMIDRIAATGQMAFTNYLMTTIVCTTIFNGYGFGLYGYLGRAELYLVVLGMWALMLLWSKPWLARFRYGPFEWLWRSLARGALQPMTR